MDQPPHLTDGDTETWRLRDMPRVALGIIRQQITSVSITGAVSNEFIATNRMVSVTPDSHIT